MKKLSKLTVHSRCFFLPGSNVRSNPSLGSGSSGSSSGAATLPVAMGSALAAVVFGAVAVFAL